MKEKLFYINPNALLLCIPTGPGLVSMSQESNTIKMSKNEKRTLKEVQNIIKEMKRQHVYYCESTTFKHT